MLHCDVEDVRTRVPRGQVVHGVNDQPLLGAGITLTQRHFEALRACSVRHIVIHPVEPETSTLTMVEAKFEQYAEQHTLIHELRRPCRSRLAERQGDIE